MIIGVSGKIGSGKDTVGKIIQSITNSDHKEGTLAVINNNYSTPDTDWQIKKFADKLKDTVCLWTGCTREQLEDADFKDTEIGKDWIIPLKEYYQDIPDYKGLYQISTFGNIKSLSRTASNGKVIKEFIKAQHIGRDKYKALTLNKNGIKKTWSVHQLMGITFYNHKPYYYDNGVVHHVDENILNNKLNNLEIVSSRYNSSISRKNKDLGVYERNGKFETYITIDNKKTYLGSYLTLEKAKEVRANKVKEIDTFIPIKYIPKKYTYRVLLQIVGTEISRNTIHNDIWVNSLFASYKSIENEIIEVDTKNLASHVNPKKLTKEICIENNIPFKIYNLRSNWIITDCRFENELKAIKKRGGISIRVNRYPERICIAREGGIGKVNQTVSFDINNQKHLDLWKGECSLQHSSETALDDATFDYVIENNGSIEDLIIKVKDILITEKII